MEIILFSIPNIKIAIKTYMLKLIRCHSKITKDIQIKALYLSSNLFRRHLKTFLVKPNYIYLSAEWLCNIRESYGILKTWSHSHYVRIFDDFKKNTKESWWQNDIFLNYVNDLSYLS